MTNTYIVINADSGDIFYIMAFNAENENDALNMFKRYIAKNDDYFREYVGEFSVNGLLDRFLVDDDGHLYQKGYSFERGYRFNHMSDDEFYEYEKMWVEKNVRNLFDTETKLAEEYLTAFYNEKNERNVIFSDELNEYVMFKFDKQDLEEFSHVEIKKLDIENSPYQIIYQEDYV